jgi:clan AA aspartic protease
MITGKVSGRRALLSVPIRQHGRPDLTIEFMIDTGFSGFLSLPPATIVTLQLPLLNRMRAEIADGSSIWVPVYRATILWNGAEIETRVLAMGRRPLLGTGLLSDHELVAQFRDGGALTVDPLP